MIIVYVHGAGATCNSFNYIKDNMSEYNNYKNICFEYDIQDGFKNNIEYFSNKMNRLSNIFFIGHSMGGIYALHLANRFPKKVLGAVTLSTPYGGVEAADYAKYLFPFYQLMKDIGTTSKPVKQSDQIIVHHPWTQIVTTSGTSPWINKANDGVVTVSSQEHHEGMELIKLPYTHHEVLLRPDIIEIIKERIEKVKK